MRHCAARNEAEALSSSQVIAVVAFEAMYRLRMTFNLTQHVILNEGT